MPELAVASGPLCGTALFVALAGGRLPRFGIEARSRALALRWLCVGLLAAFEEVLWRGLILAGMAAALGMLAALAASSAGFAVWHVSVLGRRCSVHLLTGLGFGGVFLLGGLVAAMLAHATYNVLVDWGVQAGRSPT
jgi:membrane protease YdiL (CAAX protease family)